MLKFISSRRSISTFYELFPRTFPSGKPQWKVEPLKLRKEYRDLQAQHHPDMLSATTQSAQVGGDQSSLLNKAYHTLKDPLLRSQHILKTVHGMDLNQEQVAQSLMQRNPNLLMQVLDIHEQLEEVQNEQDVHTIEQENKKRMKDIEFELAKCYEGGNFEKASNLTVELKYWVSLAKAIKEWEPGQQVTLKH